MEKEAWHGTTIPGRYCVIITYATRLCLRVGYMETAFLFTMATLRSSADRKLGLSVWLYYESYFTMNPNYYINRYSFQLITKFSIKNNITHVSRRGRQIPRIYTYYDPDI